MQAIDRELLSVFSDATIRFVIPVYQRRHDQEAQGRAISLLLKRTEAGMREAWTTPFVQGHAIPIPIKESLPG